MHNETLKLQAKSAEEARLVMAAKSQFLEATNPATRKAWSCSASRLQGRRARESKADISFTPFELQGRVVENAL